MCILFCHDDTPYCTSLRQQADQLNPENFENPGTSKSSIHCKREKYRIESLKSAQLKHVTVDAWQLCYDGKIIDGVDRYVFIGQCFDQEKVSTPLQVLVLMFLFWCCCLQPINEF